MKNTQKIKYGVGLIMSLLLFMLFLDFGSQVRDISEGIYFDKLIISYISKAVTPTIKKLMIFISFLGSAEFYIPLYIVIIIIFIRKKQYINTIASLNGVIISAVLNFLIKGYYTRVRPEFYFQIQEVGFSFPSGHSMVSISSYFILTYLIFRNKPWDIKKIMAWIGTVILVIAIGFSRIYLGVHWPTDVIAGLALGFIWAYINIIIVEILYINKNDLSQK